MGFIKNMGSKATPNSKVKFEKFQTKMSELTASMGEIFNSVSKKKKVKNSVLDVIKDFGCFVKGTEVLTSEGYKAIETIKVGDLVYSKNIETNEVELKRVYSLYTGIKEEIYEITVDKITMETTEEHPFWIVGKGWIEAKNLTENDKFIDKDGTIKTIESIVYKKTEGTQIYNFSVEDNHNYFVTSNEVLTHNISCKVVGNLIDRIGFKVKNTVTKSADDANAYWLAEGYDKSPYKPGTDVLEVVLDQDATFVRVYDGVKSGQKGGWIMKVEDIQGLTPKQIQAKFALPAEPKFIVDVNVPTGTKLRCGIANEVPEWNQPGGGFQFDTMGQWLEDWGTPRDLN